MENCEQGLENAARGHRSRAALQCPITKLSYKQPNKSSELQNTQIEFIYSDFPCLLKVIQINLR